MKKILKMNRMSTSEYHTMALRKGGRCVLMGGIMGDVALPHSRIMHWGIMIKGKWMFEAVDVRRMINLVETGVVSLYQQQQITQQEC